MKKYKTVNAIAMGSQTCVGYINTPFPRKGGNCFDLETKDGSYRVLNFKAENFEELMKRGTITWPVKIHLVGAGKLKNKCMIHDTRIPHDWYCENLCSVCTPFAMMPLTYQMQYARKIATGEIKLIKMENGDYLETQEIKATRRTLPMKSTIESLQDFVAPKDLNI